MKILYYPLFTALIALISCADNLEEQTEEFTDLQELNKAIYDEMNTQYLWSELMPDIDPLSQSKPDDYFKDLLNSLDSVSSITDDYSALLNYSSGIRYGMGYVLQFQYMKQGSAKLVAFVKYVHENSPAHIAGLKRGDLIIKCDGKYFTEENAKELYADKKISIQLGEVIYTDLVENDDEFILQPLSYQINPVLAHSIFNHNTQSIGYIAYESFIESYDEEMIDLFSEFKAQGVSDLILDLRYCNNGSANSAKLLASLIGPNTISGKVFIKNNFSVTKEDELKSTKLKVNEEFIQNSNNLNLTRVFVLTSNQTASAAEMVIYSLEPYMDVVQIGEITAGQYFISKTIELPHNWAIKPVVSKAENANNTINYDKGLEPDIEVVDVFSFPMGSEKDPAINFALQRIAVGN